MNATPPDRVRAVLETSFWVVAYRAEVAANCLDFFEIVVPRAVEAEISSTQSDVARREYPYATLFRHLRPQMTNPPAGTPAPLPKLGPGEAEAIPLAQHLSAVLLVNERRAARYAVNLGVPVVTVPLFIVALHDRGIIGQRAAQRKLALIERVTAKPIIDDARQLLDALQGEQPSTGD